MSVKIQCGAGRELSGIVLQARLDRSNFDRWPSKFHVPRPGTPGTLDIHDVFHLRDSTTWRRSSMLGLVCLQLRGMVMKVDNRCAQRTHSSCEMSADELEEAIESPRLARVGPKQIHCWKFY